jgi:hypothetical protein
MIAEADIDLCGKGDGVTPSAGSILPTGELAKLND